MSTIPTNRESDRFMLRLPDGMRDRIKVAAESNKRSMNAEIVSTLSEKYPDPEAMGALSDYIAKFLRDQGAADSPAIREYVQMAIAQWFKKREEGK